MNANGYIGIFLAVSGAALICMATADLVDKLKSEEIPATVVNMEVHDDSFNDTTFRYKDESGEEREDTFLTSADDERYYVGSEVSVKLTKNGIDPEGNGSIILSGLLDAIGLAVAVEGTYIFIRRDTIIIRNIFIK